ncbi:hypothetical protein BKA69DRAFT_283057 [Paraphysoderma sedebokerense]|nr:hypothetical protein BKA69DRAFT_283057 [Paraphysoderma sedebokerense]
MANAPRIEGIKKSIIQQYRHHVRVKPTLSSAARHILIIHEHMLYLLEGGDHRLFQILRTLVNARHHITFVHRGWSATKEAQDRLTDMGVELIGDDYYRSQGLNEVNIDDNKVLKDPAQFFRDRHFDAAILSTWFYKKNQTHHMIDSIPELYIPILQNLSPSTCIALATDDLHWIRNLDASYCHSSEANCDRVLKSRERKVYESGDVIFTASESDARLITEWIPSLKSKPPLFIPYTAEPFDPASPFSISPFSQRNKLVYIGSTHSINVASLTWFFENVLPVISKTLHPFPKIHIVGKGWNEIPQFKQYESSGLVKFVGHLTEEGVKSILKTSIMFVNPMITGTGVSTKNVLALQSGVPLITTSFGIRGLMLEESYSNDPGASPGTAADNTDEQNQQQASWVDRDDLPVLVADSPDEFAYAIVKVAKNGKLWKTLSTKGLKHARDVLNSESQLEKLEFAIDVCLQRAAKRNNLRR